MSTERWTRAGRGALAVGCVLTAAAFALGYTPLQVVGLACLAACAVAIVLTSGRIDSRTARLEVSPAQLTRGESCSVTVRWTGSENGPASGRFDSLALGAGAGLDVRALGSGRRAPAEFDVLARRRGRFVLGPLTVERADPLGLVLRRRVLAEPCDLVVHPAIHPLPMGPSADRGTDADGNVLAAARDSIVFESLREYSVGDDIRHVHWLSSLRRADGGLLVRTGLEPTEPEELLVLDDDTRAYPPDEIGAEHFDIAVDIAASIALSCVAARRPLRLATSGGLRTASRGGRRESSRLLDLFTDLQLDEKGAADDGLQTAVAGLQRVHATQLIVVTGSRSDAQTATEHAAARRGSRIVVIRVGQRASGAAAPAQHEHVVGRLGYLEKTVASLDDLATSWPPAAGREWSTTPSRRDRGHGRSVAATTA